MRRLFLFLVIAAILATPALAQPDGPPSGVDALLAELPAALPQRWEQLITALVSVVLPAILAFFRGRKLGHDAAIDGRE